METSISVFNFFEDKPFSKKSQTIPRSDVTKMSYSDSTTFKPTSLSGEVVFYAFYSSFTKIEVVVNKIAVANDRVSTSLTKRRRHKTLSNEQ